MRYKIYEFFGINKDHGNSDHLSDFGDVSSEVRRSMWAYVPYGIDDFYGETNINEEVSITDDIKKVIRFNKNTDPKILFELYKRIVINSDEIFSSENNSRYFFLKLLQLQELLHKLGIIKGSEYLLRGKNSRSIDTLTERKTSFMDGSSSVEVKKKCRLGGQGNKSAQCNQGDINNLIMKPITEEITKLEDVPFNTDVEKLGGKVYAVGGAVRDEFLGKESKDLDLLITGVDLDTLEKILLKYGRVDSVGKSFGIIKFKQHGSSEELDIAIPRKDSASGEGGHKGIITKSDHTLSIEDDLKRRDFTFNAMARDINGELVDPYNGASDLKNKIIRVVDPIAFAEDPLRMLRAVQFAARFGFTIEKTTLSLITKNAKRIKEIPGERIITEFDKIVNKGKPSLGGYWLIKTGLYEQIFNTQPRFKTTDNNNVSTLGEFVFLLTNGSIKSPSEFFRVNLKGDLDTINEIRAFELGFQETNINKTHLRSTIFNMYKISPMSLNSNILPNNIKVATKELLSGRYPKTLKEVDVNGNDLIELGLVKQQIGEMQKKILINIFADKLNNNKEEIIQFVKNNK